MFIRYRNYVIIHVHTAIATHFSTSYLNFTTWERQLIFLIAILNSFLFFRLSIFYYLPARSVDDFISLTNATRKNPHEWRTPLINALLSNIEKQMRKACKLSFVNPCDSFSVLFDSSSSHKRAFSLFAILKMGFVALCFSAKWWRFLRDNVTTLSTSLYTPIYRINPQPKTTTVLCILL